MASPSQPRSKNVAILLIGPPGSGKSSFVKSVTGVEVKTEDGTNTCTEKCTTHIAKRKVNGSEETFAIIDTPGLHDSHPVSKRLKVLDEIANYLLTIRPLEVSGVIYFQDILHKRLTGTDRDNVRALKLICGNDFFPHVAFLTTMWDRVSPHKLPEHEIRNKCFEEQYRKLIPPIPNIFKFYNDETSNRLILEHFARSAKAGKAPRLLFVKELEHLSRSRVRGLGNKKLAEKTSVGQHILEKEESTNMCTIL